MTYLINYYEEMPVASVYVTEEPGVDSVMLHDLVSATLDASGQLVDLDLSDTRMFGDPFDQAAAVRAVEWAREQLAARAAV